MKPPSPAPGGAPDSPPDGRAAAEAERRAQIRRFALAHHPDRGGDPEFFATELRALREGRSPYRPDIEITTYRRRSGLGLVLAWAQRRWTTYRRPPRVR